MNWEDECYLLSKRKFRENANIINVLSKNRGKVSGVVYGGNSRKIKNYLQISNKLYINHNAKNENRLGYFKTELVKPISPLYFNDKERSSALLSITSILNILLPDSQPNQNIYKSFEEFVNSIKLDNWIILYLNRITSEGPPDILLVRGIYFGEVILYACLVEAGRREGLRFFHRTTHCKCPSWGGRLRISTGCFQTYTSWRTKI